MRYMIGLKVSNYYSIHIFENEYESKVLVEEKNIEGFIQCLEFFGFQNAFGN